MDTKYKIANRLIRDVARFSNTSAQAVMSSAYLVGKGLTETPNTVWAKAHIAHPLTTSLLIDVRNYNYD